MKIDLVDGASSGTVQAADAVRGWVTYERKDGSGKHSGTFATNPDYVRVHHEWKWLAVDRVEPSEEMQ